MGNSTSPVSEELKSWTPDDIAFGCRCGHALGVEPGRRRRVTVICPSCKTRMRVTCWINEIPSTKTAATEENHVQRQ